MFKIYCTQSVPILCRDEKLAVILFANTGCKKGVMLSIFVGCEFVGRQCFLEPPSSLHLRHQIFPLITVEVDLYEE